MHKRNMKLSAKLSFKEELANSISHGLGALLMLCLLPVAAIHTYKNYHFSSVIGICIFVTSLFLMFLASTIYHAMNYESTQKYVLRIIDHSMIFVAIAGSYTPIALIVIGGIKGYVIIFIQWLLAIIGIIYKATTMKKKDIMGILLYLGMGWTALFLLPSLLRDTNFVFLTLMVLGGIFYTLGVVFYAKKKPYAHTIWHMFILVASICHYIAIVFLMR